jgi:hypothetical protein
VLVCNPKLLLKLLSFRHRDFVHKLPELKEKKNQREEVQSPKQARESMLCCVLRQQTKHAASVSGSTIVAETTSACSWGTHKVQCKKWLKEAKEDAESRAVTANWAKGLTEADQYEWLSNCYQMRCDDDYVHHHGVTCMVRTLPKVRNIRTCHAILRSYVH